MIDYGFYLFWGFFIQLFILIYLIQELLRTEIAKNIY